jgi:hypothetical protein
MTRRAATPTASAEQKGTKKVATLSRKLLSRPMFGLFVPSQLFVCLESWGGTSFSKNAIFIFFCFGFFLN